MCVLGHYDYTGIARRGKHLPTKRQCDRRPVCWAPAHLDLLATVLVDHPPRPPPGSSLSASLPRCCPRTPNVVRGHHSCFGSRGPDARTAPCRPPSHSMLHSHQSAHLSSITLLTRFHQRTNSSSFSRSLLLLKQRVWNAPRKLEMT